MDRAGVIGEVREKSSGRGARSLNPTRYSGHRPDVRVEYIERNFRDPPVSGEFSSRCPAPVGKCQQPPAAPCLSTRSQVKTQPPGGPRPVPLTDRQLR